MHKVVADATAKGPYSTATIAGDFLFLSGQGAVDPHTLAPRRGDVVEETALTLANVRRLLQDQGLDFENLVSVTCYLTDMADWPALNDEYARVLGDDARPVRTAVAVSELPFGLRVEMTCVAYSEGLSAAQAGPR